MKITLQSHIEAHREIAKMFVGVNYYKNYVLRGFGGAFDMFLVESYRQSNGYDFHLVKEITIDLSQVELDLRMAIGTDIEFNTKHNKGLKIEQITKYVNSVCFGLWKDGKKIGEFESHRIQLSADWLKSVGVEVEE